MSGQKPALELVDAINNLGYRVANAASTAYALDLMLEHCGSSNHVRQEARSVAEGMHHVLEDLADRIMDLADGLRMDAPLDEPAAAAKPAKRKAVRP